MKMNAWTRRCLIVLSVAMAASMFACGKKKGDGEWHYAVIDITYTSGWLGIDFSNDGYVAGDASTYATLELQYIGYAKTDAQIDVLIASQTNS